MAISRIFHFAESTPDAIAIYRHGSELSYREFAAAIGSARAEFIDRRIKGKGIVGIAIWDLQQFWICGLALRSLGLTILPIRSPDALPDLLVPGLRYVVGPASWPGLEHVCEMHGLSLIPPPCLAGSSVKPEAHETLDGGHILVTSGTTGRSKMVMWDSAAFEATFGSNPEASAETVNHVFDYGPWTLAGFRRPSCAWHVGGGVIFHQQSERHKAFLNRRGTDAVLLPNFLTQVLSAPEGSFPFNKALRLSVAGGTITAAQLQDSKRRICPNVINRLSATEVGSIAITPLHEAEDQRWHSILPGVEIVDDQDRVVPPGQVGQLRVPVRSGPSEYFNDSETTAQFFRNGYFYPGDLAIARDDGRVALQGRTTEVVNINGSKESAGRLEDYVREQHKLTGVCLLSAQDDQGEERVYAVVETTVPAPHELLERIATTFADVPLRVFPVAALPRTSTGKVIRAEVQSQLLASLNNGIGDLETVNSRAEP